MSADSTEQPMSMSRANGRSATNQSLDAIVSSNDRNPIKVNDVKDALKVLVPALFNDDKSVKPLHYAGVSETPTVDGYNQLLTKKDKHIYRRNHHVIDVCKALIKAIKENKEIYKINYMLPKYNDKLTRALKDEEDKAKEKVEAKDKTRKRKASTLQLDEDYTAIWESFKSK